jgi:hypothetical protein
MLCWRIRRNLGILHLGLKVVYTFRKPEFGQSYSVGNNSGSTGFCGQTPPPPTFGKGIFVNLK